MLQSQLPPPALPQQPERLQQQHQHHHQVTVTYSATEQEVFKAIVDTFVGSVQLTTAKLDELSARYSVPVPVLKAYFEQKGSDVDVHAKCIRHLQTNVRPEEARALKLLLLALSTSVGTFALTGVPHGPFTSLSPDEREAALRTWKHSYFALIRKMFLGLKTMTALTYFMATDEFERTSVAWRALRYPGPPAQLFEQAVPSFDFVFENPGSLHNAHYDAIVVGSGCGGGVTAAVLSQAGHRVLVLEKGSFYRRDQYTLTEESAYAMLYEDGIMTTTDDTCISIGAGSVFGGGSQINWSASFKTPDPVRKEWADVHKVPFFASPRYDAALDAVCQRLGVHDTHIAHNGPNSKIVEGSARLGHDVGTIPHNAPGEHSCGWCTFGCTRGLKQGMQETFLADAAKAGAHFVVNANVHRIEHRNGRATGIVATYSDGKQTRTFKVHAKVVVVSAGSLNSPVLLLRSGLKNKNIGRHLRLHPVSMVRGEFPGQDIDPWEGCNMSAVSRVVADRNGSGYGALIETPIIHPGFGVGQMPWRSLSEFKTHALGLKNSAHLLVLVRDSGSGGTIEVDRDGRKLINYQLNQFDVDSAVEGIVASVKILVAAGATEIQAGSPDLATFKPRSTDVDDPALQRYLTEIRRHGLPMAKAGLFSAHQMGTCRLGNDKGAASVLNPHGETWEIKNLFVADASTFPTASGVNPMITTEATAYVIAHNVADRLAELKRRQATSPVAAQARL